MSPRTGRPKSKEPKATQLGVRFNEFELKQLDECAKHYKTTRAETLRIGVKELHKGIKK